MCQHEREQEAANKGSHHSDDLIFWHLVAGQPDELLPGSLENYSIPKGRKKTLRCGRNDNQGQEMTGDWHNEQHREKICHEHSSTLLQQD
jgi:hypothetical protein